MPAVGAHSRPPTFGSTAGVGCEHLLERVGVGRGDLVGGGRAGDDLAVELGGVEQLVVVALGDDAPVVEHDDLVGEFDRREAVRDHERGAPGHRLGERDLDALLGRRVDRGGGVVEHEHARVGDERPRDRQTLALPAGERDAALADLGFIALRQPRDELVRLRVARGLFDLGDAARPDARRRCSRRRLQRTGTGRR